MVTSGTTPDSIYGFHNTSSYPHSGQIQSSTHWSGFTSTGHASERKSRAWPHCVHFILQPPSYQGLSLSCSTRSSNRVRQATLQLKFLCHNVGMWSMNQPSFFLLSIIEYDSRLCVVCIHICSSPCPFAFLFDAPIQFCHVYSQWPCIHKLYRTSTCEEKQSAGRTGFPFAFLRFFQLDLCIW